MTTQYQSLTTADGLSLHKTTWLPAGQTKADVILVHGLGEHSGRYEHISKALTEAGFAVHAVDLRGHGRSEGPRGHTPSMQAYLDDINRLFESLNSKLPVFLYGHSLGGLIIIHLALQHQDQLRGLIISSPGLKRALEVPLYKIILGRLLSRFWPSFTMETGLDPEALSRVEDVVEAYRSDPLVHAKATARFFTSFTDAGPIALERAPEIHIPVAVIQGGADQLVSAEASQKFFEQAASTEKSLIFIPEAFHETHNEADGHQVIHKIVDWVSDHL